MSRARTHNLRRICSQPLAIMAVCLFLTAVPAAAQNSSDHGSTSGGGQNQRAPSKFNVTNPISLLNSAGQILPGPDTSANSQASGLSTTLSIVLLLTVLSLAPAILVMCTSFTRIVVVLALLRQAIGTQTLPPSQVITGLALFMTFLVMGPTFNRINHQALVPLENGQITQAQAWKRAEQPLRDFMFDQIQYAGNWKAVYMMLNYEGVNTSHPGKLRRKDVGMLALIPAFILSELKVAFLMGFRLYLPFLIIDMVVASVLISMGMMMLPPVLISLPFKLLLFVMVDGWQLVAGNLLNSFAIPGVTT